MGNSVCRDFLSLCHEYKILFVVRHIEGPLNVLADKGSRTGPISSETMLDQDSLLSTWSQWNLFPWLDVFASRETSRCCSYVSPCPDPKAFAIDASMPMLVEKFVAFK